LKASETATFDSAFQVLESNGQPKDYFLANIPVKGIQYLDFVSQKKGKTTVWITIGITANLEAMSLPNAPFGGFWFEKGLNSIVLEEFLKSVIEDLQRRGVKRLTINQPPKAYVLQSDLVNYLLFKAGFKLKNVLSHQFFCGAKKIKKFLDSESPKIRKQMKENGLVANHKPISNFDFLKKIKQWNTSKGYEFTVNEANLIQQVSDYPERYFLISLQKGEQIIGYALAVFLTTNSVYYYLSALDSCKEAKGGGDFILLELFLLAREKKVDFIDLGSSDNGDLANHNLIFFKSRFSNEIANKISWSKEF